MTLRRLTLIVPMVLLLVAMACTGGGGTRSSVASEAHALPDTLTVGTIYSPTSFFILRGDTMGYDYDRMCDFARSQGIGLRFKVARSIGVLIDWLQAGEVDVLGCEIPVTAEYREVALHCGAENITWQVLVQHTGDSMVNDVTQLVGRQVYVEAGSKYESRLHNLDTEVGGGIDIQLVEGDSLTAEDLIAMVSRRELPLTIVDSDIAQMNETYLDSIDIHLRVGFPQRSSWAVAPDAQWLADSIDAWASSTNAQAYSKSAMKHYFEINKKAQRDSDSIAAIPVTPPGAISPYDSLFRHYAPSIHWDWRLLAAVSYVESGFNPTVVSWAGARGIMQLMPNTARAYGLKDNEFTNAEKGVDAAVRFIADLDGMMSRRVRNRNERIKFILASYNAGAGHIIDAIELARKHNLRPDVWYENVEEALKWKSKPEYYNDSVCHSGYFRADQTVNYVRSVEDRFAYYQAHYKK